MPRSLLSKHLRARNGNGSNGKRKPRPTSESLAEHILRVTPAERLAAARIIGVDTVWDEMIAPVIAAEQAAE